MVALELVREDEDEGAHRCDASDLSTSPRGEAEAAKARGNESFARGEFERAREAYTEALARVGAEERTTRGTDGSFIDRSSVDADDGGRADVDVLAAACFANRAACLTRLGKHREAIEDCDAALEIDPAYVKVYVRRASAREAVGELEGALEDYERARALAPKEASARRAADRLRPVVERRREEMKEEMLSKMKDLGNSLLGNFGLSLDNFKAQKDETTGSFSIQFVRDEEKKTTPTPTPMDDDDDE